MQPHVDHEQLQKARTKFTRDLVVMVLFLCTICCLSLFFMPPFSYRTDLPPDHDKFRLKHYAELQDVVINDFEPYPVGGGPAKVALFNRRDHEISVDDYNLVIMSTNSPLTFSPLSLTIPPTEAVTTTLPQPLSEAVAKSGGQLLFQDPSRERTLDTLSFAPLQPIPIVKEGVDGEERWEKRGIEEGEVYYRQPAGGLWSEKMGREFPVERRPKPIIGTHDDNFEIHVLDVGQGDSQLIIFPSGYSILIDVNEDQWNSDIGAKYVSERIEEIQGNKHVNVGVISHLHLDHLGYAEKGGFWALIEKYNITFDKILDRNSAEWNDKNTDGECDYNNEIEWINAGTYSGTATHWLCYALNPKNTKIHPIREVATLCSDTQINPPDKNANVKIITVDGEGASMVKGGSVSGDHTTEDMPPSENDFSIGLLITFGDFSYVTCGDLDGEYANSSYGYTYNDIEAIVAPRVGEVDVYHLNHHGSGHSSSKLWLDVTTPRVSIGSCGLRNSYGHPDQTTVDRIFDHESDLYITSDCDTDNNYYTTVRANSDIVVRSKDGKDYTITAGGVDTYYPSKGIDRSQYPCP
uniref:Metallo-beta-lactamase domain-containing protein n=1 Tax=Paramoeba aestuarina TaxID=180227 RepID=A0A7S4NAJ6_9EUKA|eukprot:CAMPEP_0201539490 /NCGR_PEP_ID=MMETSP0161_2-20130828/70432_1 /ASSEMBLY_ACC=CAM_ASM_000251 /TAXON_ID=180227 /ORGANISM="Neoparamoeba aestuarina, Strain SoJaBio B1-5/56/2" /LENGTH=577 /DNA_ID=CAMNT_0047946889 /DNA_START=56 /DNA_END=1789 /DNA_ORIENTATION=+